MRFFILVLVKHLSRASILNNYMVRSLQSCFRVPHLGYERDQNYLPVANVYNI